MGLDDLDSAKLSVLAAFLGIIVVPILYVDVYGIKTQNNSVLVQKEKSSRFEHTRRAHFPSGRQGVMGKFLH